MADSPQRELNVSDRRLSALHFALLILFSVFAFAPGTGSLPPTDRDESRYMQATKQMIESGDFIDIRLQDVPRYKKPVGIYWLQAAAVLVSGQGSDAPPWVYRTVSVLAGTLAVLTIAWLGARMFGTTAGLIAGFGLAGIAMMGWEARIAKTDAALLVAALVTQAALAVTYLGHKQGRQAPRAAWVFWIAQGAGILIKGPITPMLGFLTIATIAIFDRDRAWLKRLRIGWGLLVTFLIVLPWLVLITWKSGGAFWAESVGNDLLGKVGSGQESHGFPPGYHAIVATLFLFPFHLPAVTAALGTLPRWRTDPRVLFLVSWFIPYWIAFELIWTKLPHYMLPAYPAIILVMAGVLGGKDFPAEPLTGWKRWLVWAATAGVFIVTAGLMAISIGLAPYVTGVFNWWGIPVALLVLAAGWLGSGLWPPVAPLPRTALAAAASAAAFGVLSTAVIPRIDPMWLSPQIAGAFDRVKPCADSRLISVGYGGMPAPSPW
jgi:4-amino-4-deoxy-L-arabinose transferase-like glycosyltransferase